MAAMGISGKIVKLVIIGGSVPVGSIALGYRMRSVQAAENKAQGTPVIRACDLPIYNTSAKKEYGGQPSEEIYFPILMEGITSVRKAVESAIESVQEPYENVKSKVETGIAHSKASLDFVQNNPSDLSRAVVIGIAGLSGAILGYKGSALRKGFYSLVLASSMTAVCYPKKTVELSEQAYSEVLSLIDSATSSNPKPTVERLADTSPSVLVTDNATAIKEKSPQSVKGDPGMSNPADKDMYSTRSS